MLRLRIRLLQEQETKLYITETAIRAANILYQMWTCFGQESATQQSYSRGSRRAKKRTLDNIPRIFCDHIHQTAWSKQTLTNKRNKLQQMAMLDTILYNRLHIILYNKSSLDFLNTLQY